MYPSRPLSIAQIGTADAGGGAAAVATGLMRGLQLRGHRVRHFVGRKHSGDPDVVLLPDDDRALARATGYTALRSSLLSLAARYPGRGIGLASRGLRLLTHPRALACWHAGIEDFEFPGSRHVLAGFD
ncbi:MAG TPA: hypothetical protein VEA16_15325, partial [Vicinamibacterales bacterium]|nr:hypothetical protein [Vicinamibacterales bacterium]